MGQRRPHRPHPGTQTRRGHARPSLQDRHCEISHTTHMSYLTGAIGTGERSVVRAIAPVAVFAVANCIGGWGSCQVDCFQGRSIFLRYTLYYTGVTHREARAQKSIACAFPRYTARPVFTRTTRWVGVSCRIACKHAPLPARYTHGIDEYMHMPYLTAIRVGKIAAA